MSAPRLKFQRIGDDTTTPDLNLITNDQIAALAVARKDYPEFLSTINLVLGEDIIDPYQMRTRGMMYYPFVPLEGISEKKIKGKCIFEMGIQDAQSFTLSKYRPPTKDTMNFLALGPGNGNSGLAHFGGVCWFHSIMNILLHSRVFLHSVSELKSKGEIDQELKNIVNEYWSEIPNTESMKIYVGKLMNAIGKVQCGKETPTCYSECAATANISLEYKFFANALYEKERINLFSERAFLKYNKENKGLEVSIPEKITSISIDNSTNIENTIRALMLKMQTDDVSLTKTFYYDINDLLFLFMDNGQSVNNYVSANTLHIKINIDEKLYQPIGIIIYYPKHYYCLYKNQRDRKWYEADDIKTPIVKEINFTQNDQQWRLPGHQLVGIFYERTTD